MSASAKRPCFIICHADHNHDSVFADNLTEFFLAAGIASRTITLNHDGQRPELAACLQGSVLGVLGFNSQLDHSWIGDDRFLDLAARHGIPVIQWILDHPSSRLLEFDNSTPANSRFLFSSAEAELYFRNYGITGARTAHVASVGPSRHSRVDELTLAGFAQRPISCMAAMNLRRIGGTIEDARARVAALPSPLARVVETAIEAALPDPMRPLVAHFNEALAAAGLDIPNPLRHACMQMIEEIVQITRRQRIFDVLREFPMLIQSDEASRPFQPGAAATFAENVAMAPTWSRLRQCRAQVSISNMHDMVHDRILNGLNAGCLNIVEDSLANRAAFRHGVNALFFRYGDDSLRECVSLAHDAIDRAFAIAAPGRASHDERPLIFGKSETIAASTGG